MSNIGMNEGFRILDEFVCQTMYADVVPKTAEQHFGRNEGFELSKNLHSTRQLGNSVRWNIHFQRISTGQDSNLFFRRSQFFHSCCFPVASSSVNKK